MASYLSTIVSLAGSAVFIRSVVKDFLSESLEEWLSAKLQRITARFSTDYTVTIYEYDDHVANQIFKAAEVCLADKSSATSVRVSMPINKKHTTIAAGDNDEIVDWFDGIKCKWLLTYETVPGVATTGHHGAATSAIRIRLFYLNFHKKHVHRILHSYLPKLVEQYLAKMDYREGIKIHAIRHENLYEPNAEVWAPVSFNHPSTFDTLAMEPEAKEAVKKDLDLFLSRRDYYRKVGKAWKRGYLLYGPPGTGKSSLIAAMANYLKFHVYDLELTEFYCNSELKKLLLATANKSILVIEDIDCSIKLKNREDGNNADDDEDDSDDEKITLSGILNFIDGLWSSCGDERIIIFTTNHKEKLDPALLRPGRMDMHIHMSYCTFAGFKVLASNYHGIEKHDRFEEIEELMKHVEVSPAEVAEELLRRDDVELALQELINFLENKKKEKDLASQSGQSDKKKKKKRKNRKKKN